MIAHLGVGSLAYAITDSLAMGGWQIVCGLAWLTCVGPMALRLNQRFLPDRMLLARDPGQFGYVPRAGESFILRCRFPLRFRHILPALIWGMLLAYADLTMPRPAIEEALNTCAVLATVVLGTCAGWWLLTEKDAWRALELAFYRTGALLSMLASMEITFRALSQ